MARPALAETMNVTYSQTSRRTRGAYSPIPLADQSPGAGGASIGTLNCFTGPELNESNDGPRNTFTVSDFAVNEANVDGGMFTTQARHPSFGRT